MKSLGNIFNSEKLGGEGFHLASYFRSDDDEHVYWAISSDYGVNWYPIGSVRESLLRDPAPIRQDDQWIVFGTDAEVSASGSFNVEVWDSLTQQKSVSALDPGNWDTTWAPEPFTDTNGDKYLVISGTNWVIQSGDDIPRFSQYIVPITDFDPVTIGTSVALNTLTTPYRDGVIVRTNDGVYHLFTCKGAIHASTYIEHHTAVGNSLLAANTAGWTAVHADNALGLGSAAEAPSVIQLPDSETSYRVFYDRYLRGGELWYFDTHNNFSTVSSPQRSNIPDSVRHAGIVDARDVPSLYGEVAELVSVTNYSPRSQLATAKKTGNTTCNNNATALVSWDIFTAPDGASTTYCWDDFADAFVAPNDGVYDVSASIMWDATTATNGLWWFSLGKNTPDGGSVDVAYAVATSSVRSHGEQLVQQVRRTIKLARGDRLRLSVYQNSGAARTITGTTDASWAGAQIFWDVRWVA